jgi:hypothetical protein
MVVVCRSRRACRLFSRSRAVSCWSCLVVLRKYEAYNEARLDPISLRFKSPSSRVNPSTLTAGSRRAIERNPRGLAQLVQG